MRKPLLWLALGLFLFGVVFVAQKIIRSKSEKGRTDALVPSARASLENVRQELANMGIQTFVGSTYRTADQQADLVGSRSSTNRSWHRARRAVDLYPRLGDGKPDLNGENVDRFRVMHSVAQKHGWRGIAFKADGSKRLIQVRPGKRIWDGGHIEFRQGLTWDQAMDKVKDFA